MNPPDQPLSAASATATPPPLPPRAEFGPLAGGAREPTIDALRGVAIFGIFLVNIIGFKVPMIAASDIREPWIGGGANELVLTVNAFLIQGCFISIFALLFGIGMAAQEQRVRASGKEFTRFHLRRMSALLALGLAHAALLWAGDILAIYAVFGMIGLLFVRRGVKTLLIWAGAIFVVMIPVFAGYGVLMVEGGDDKWYRDMGEWWVEIYLTGSFGQIVAARLSEWGIMMFSGVISILPYAFAVFLVGLAVGKSAIHRNPELWLEKFRRWVPLALLLGLVAGSGYVAMTAGQEDGAVLHALGMAGYLVRMPLLAFCYVILFIQLVRSERLPGLTGKLAAVGRLGLSNYIAQSVVANILFMGWGFGLYGNVGAAAGAGIVAVVFTAQLFLSEWWLRHFRIGPIEWLWRTMAYGSPPEFRRREGQSEAR